MIKGRIRHIYHHGRLEPDAIKFPRGWISPEGRFFKTKEHWQSIMSQFRRPEIRSLSEVPEEDLAEGERRAQLSYSLGWISVGHAGELNAVGHERTFKKITHPATVLLRKLLADFHERTIHVELQVGLFDPSLGVHESFDVREYDLDAFVKRGRLIDRRLG